MKKIVKYTSAYIDDKWTRPGMVVSHLDDTTVPAMHTWVEYGQLVAAYFAHEGETPTPATPEGIALLKVSPRAEQAAKKSAAPAKKNCGCGQRRSNDSATSTRVTAAARDKRPDDACWVCAEKHLGTAYALYKKEAGYKELNRWHYVGELNNAVNHLWHLNQDYAEKIRDLRHSVQLEKNVADSRWQELAQEFYSIRKLDLSTPGKIFIFSNVAHSAKERIAAEKDTLLVFLNKALPADIYSDYDNKCVFHRSNKPEYGALRSDMPNFFAFDDIPRDIMAGIKSGYDWNYEIEEGKIKSCTTGYMVALYLEKKYPDAEIVLVNFGYQVEKSTYRCPWHNWTFEDGQLQRFKHIYTN